MRGLADCDRKGAAVIVDNSPETRTKREKYHAFRKGWRDGATCRTKDARYLTHPTRPDLKSQYERGYQSARDAVAVAFMGEAERLHHDPSMDLLRSDPATEPEAGPEECDAKHQTRTRAHCGLPKGHRGYHNWRPRGVECEHVEVKSAKFPECMGCGCVIWPSTETGGAER